MTVNNATGITLDDWCAQVRQLWADLATPIESPDDPRYAELQSQVPFDIAVLSPADLGEAYFEKCVPLAAPPITQPAWLESVTVRATAYPEIEIEWLGQLFTDGDMTARAMKLFTVWADAAEYASENNRIAGDRTDPAPEVDTGSHTLDDLTADRAESLSRVLMLAAADLRRA